MSRLFNRSNESELKITGSKMVEIQSALSDFDGTVSPPNLNNSPDPGKAIHPSDACGRI